MKGTKHTSTERKRNLFRSRWNSKTSYAQSE